MLELNSLSAIISGIGATITSPIGLGTVMGVLGTTYFIGFAAVLYGEIATAYDLLNEMVSFGLLAKYSWVLYILQLWHKKEEI